MSTAAESALRPGTRTRRGSSVRVVVQPHWVNAWLLRSTARPYLRLDGTEHALTWSHAQTFPLAPGQHHLETFWRYRGSATALGTGSLRLRITEGEDAVVVARNGPLNHQPLQPRLQA